MVFSMTIAGMPADELSQVYRRRSTRPWRCRKLKFGVHYSPIPYACHGDSPLPTAAHASQLA